MKLLIVLISTTIVAFIVLKIFNGSYDLFFSARIGMSVMLLFTAMGHFMFTKGMALMMPQWIPYKTAWVYLTAFFEVAGAIGLHIASLRWLAAWLLILFFVLVLPVNINAALKKIDYQKATFDGKGINYLWFRIPLQLLYIAWVYFSAIYIV